MTNLFNDQDQVSRLLQIILGIKSSPWKYEKEIRVITSQSGRHDYDFRAVKTIYFGLRMPDSHKQEIMHALKGREIAYKQITLANNSYKLNYVEVEDLYDKCEKYKYSVAPIAEHAISIEYIEDELKESVEYLYKAAEIVRREPYCNEVQVVDFRPNEEAVNKPIVWVQYQRKENRCINHYLSLAEIDRQYAQINDL